MLGLKDIQGISIARSADDTDPCFDLWYDGTGTGTASVHSVVANTMRLIYNGTTTDFLLSNAAYDTFGELQDAVNALAGWHLKRRGATRADNTYSGDLKIVAFGATNAKTNAGITAFFDTSNWDARSLPLGVESIVNGIDGGVMDAAFRTSISNLPYNADPIYGNYSPDDGSPKFQNNYGSNFQGATFVGSYGGGEVATWTFTKCTDVADGETFIYKDTAATTGVKSIIGSDIIGEGFATANGWIVVKVTAGGQAITASTLSLTGKLLGV